MLLAAAAKCPEPQPPHGAAKGDESPAVQRHAEIADVPPYDQAQIRALLRDGLVHASPKLLLQFGELGLHALSHRLSKHDEFSSPRLSTAVGKAEEVEDVGLRTPTVVPVLLGLAAGWGQAGVVGVHLQSEPRQPRTQLVEEPLGLLAMLKPSDEVIGEVHAHDVSARALLPPPVDPEVERIMMIDVGQER